MKNLKPARLIVVGAILGLLSSLMILLPVLSVSTPEGTYTGIELTFGKELLNWGGFVSAKIMFSPLNLLAFALPLLGSLCLLFFRKSQMIGAVVFIIAAILLFFLPNFTTVNQTILGTTSEIDIDWTMDIGLIAAMSLSMIAAVFSILGAVAEKELQ
ncbi:MAG: hypothetical protein RBQ91_07660 [Acholeplasma sp.]|nr:hypothetical protein [Acholeplasma sp.]